MKLVISDLHASDTGAFSKLLPTGVPRRFQSLLDVLTQVERLIEERQPSDLLILGDVLHRRHFVRFALFDPLLRAIQRLTERVNRTVILVGNHDMEDDRTHGLYAFGFLPNTTLMEKPGPVRLSMGEMVTAIPYLSDPLAMADAFDRAPRDQVVISHYAAEGVPLASDYWLDSPIKLGELARFPQVLFGHIHVPSVQLDGRVVNCGSVYHFDFGDKGDRYATLVHDDRNITRLPLSAPQFLTLTWPRIPPPPVCGAYARILGVPAKKVLEAKEAAQRMGWLDSDVHREAALPEMRAAIASGLVVDRATLEALVLKKAPELTDDQRAAVVDAGEALLLEARK